MEIGQMAAALPQTIGIKGGCSSCICTSPNHEIYGKRYCDSCLAAKFGITKREVTFRHGEHEWDADLITEVIRQHEAYKAKPTNPNLRNLNGVRVKCKRTGLQVQCLHCRDIYKNAICALNVFFSSYPTDGEVDEKGDIIIEAFGAY